MLEKMCLHIQGILIFIEQDRSRCLLVSGKNYMIWKKYIVKKSYVATSISADLDSLGKCCLLIITQKRKN